MLLAEPLSRLDLDHFTGRKRAFVVVLVNLDHTLADIPPAKLRNLLRRDRVGLPRDVLTFDVQDVLRPAGILRFGWVVEPESRR